MKELKRAGIWMDHSNAYILNIDNELTQVTNVESAFTKEVKDSVSLKGESHMHNKEQHQQSEFYKKLGEVVLQKDAVLLFGPSTAKTELLHLLRADHRYEKIEITVETTEKMSEGQREAYVRNYFKNAQ